MKHFIKLKCIVITMLLMCSVSVWAQTHWTVNPSDYQYDMSVYAKVTVNGNVVDHNNVELAAFVGDECRGVAEVQENPDNSVIYYLRVRSNEASGEKISFKLWDGSQVVPVYLDNSLVFENQAANGIPSEPLELTDVKPFTLGDVNDDGKINVFDIAAVRMYILKKDPSKFIFEAADLDNNGKINVFDIANIRKIILNK